MKPTNEELRAAIEYMARIAKRGQIIWSSEPGAMTTDKAAAILRAHLETFDEERAYLRAATDYDAAVAAMERGAPLNMAFEHELSETQKAAYRALVAKRDKP